MAGSRRTRGTLFRAANGPAGTSRSHELEHTCGFPPRRQWPTFDWSERDMTRRCMETPSAPTLERIRQSPPRAVAVRPPCAHACRAGAGPHAAHAAALRPAAEILVLLQLAVTANVLAFHTQAVAQARRLSQIDGALLTRKSKKKLHTVACEGSGAPSISPIDGARLTRKRKGKSHMVAE